MTVDEIVIQVGAERTLGPYACLIALGWLLDSLRPIVLALGIREVAA